MSVVPAVRHSDILPAKYDIDVVAGDNLFLSRSNNGSTIQWIRTKRLGKNPASGHDFDCAVRKLCPIWTKCLDADAHRTQYHNGNADSNGAAERQHPHERRTVPPAAREVRVGTTVTWVNNEAPGGDTYTVTSGVNGTPDGKVHSGTLPRGHVPVHVYDSGFLPLLFPDKSNRDDRRNHCHTINKRAGCKTPGSFLVRNLFNAPLLTQRAFFSILNAGTPNYQFGVPLIQSKRFMAFKIGDRVRFINLGKFKRRPLFPPPAVGTPHTYEGDLGPWCTSPTRSALPYVPMAKNTRMARQRAGCFAPKNWNRSIHDPNHRHPRFWIAIHNAHSAPRARANVYCEIFSPRRVTSAEIERLNPRGIIFRADPPASTMTAHRAFLSFCSNKHPNFGHLLRDAAAGLPTGRKAWNARRTANLVLRRSASPIRSRFFRTCRWNKTSG